MSGAPWATLNEQEHGSAMIAGDATPLDPDPELASAVFDLFELVPAADAATQLRLGRAGRLGFNALLGSARARKTNVHVIVDPFSNQTERTLA